MYRCWRPAPTFDLGLARRAATVAALTITVPLAACTAGDDPGAAGGTAAAQDVVQAGEPDRALGFGDPGDIEGFEPVTDIEVDPVDDDDFDPPDFAAPDDVVPDVVERMQPAAAGQGLLDTVAAVDTIDEVPASRDGRSRNEAGERATLDESASLACAQIELAIDQIDSGFGGIAAERILAGSKAAEASQLVGIQAWAEPLGDVVVGGSGAELAPLLGFLSVCTEGGYEL